MPMSVAQVTLEALMEDIIAALDNKNPGIKAETASFLSRCFARCTQATLPKKLLKAFCFALLKVGQLCLCLLFLLFVVALLPHSLNFCVCV